MSPIKSRSSLREYVKANLLKDPAISNEVIQIKEID